MNNVLPFPDEVSRDVRAWLYEQNITGLLNEACAFGPDGLVDMDATFSRHSVLALTEPGSDIAHTDIVDGVWCVQIGEALSAEAQHLARGRALGQMLLHHLAVRSGSPEVGAWMQRIYPREPYGFAQAARDQIAVHTITPRGLWGKYFPRRA